MAVTVRFGDRVREMAGGPCEVEAQASTVRDALTQVMRACPKLGPRLLNCDGELRSIVRITRRGEDVAPTDTTEDGDELILEI